MLSLCLPGGGRRKCSCGELTRSICPKYLGHFPHDVQNHASDKAWDNAPTCCQCNTKGFLVNPSDQILCMDWQQPFCCCFKHLATHECSGCGDSGHEPKCALELKKDEALTPYMPRHGSTISAPSICLSDTHPYPMGCSMFYWSASLTYLSPSPLLIILPLLSMQKSLRKLYIKNLSKTRFPPLLSLIIWEGKGIP